MKKVFEFPILVLLAMSSCSSGDNDNTGQPGHVISFTETEVSVDEDMGEITFTVKLNGDVEAGFHVDFATEEGTATQSMDFVENSGTLRFQGDDGETQDITIGIHKDVFKESIEDFRVRLSNISTNNVGIATNTAVGRINDVIELSGNLSRAGASANDILQNNNFDKLVVQLAYVSGYAPSQETIDNFITYLQQRTYKEDIEMHWLELDSPGEASLTLQEIAELESANRTVYNNGLSTMAIYIYFADAPSEGDNLDQGLVTLGAVYRNTSMVIFEHTIRTMAERIPNITTTNVETATLNHEFGHLFGLVNLGTVPINNHEDPQARSHCAIEGCLMRAELTFAPLITNSKDDLVPACALSGNSVLKLLEFQASRGQIVVPGLDDQCILDLRRNGGR